MDHVAALEQRAIECARRGEFGTTARDLNDELTKAAPENQGAWTRLARCCLELGQLDDATAALDAVLQVNPQNTIARNLLIEVSKRRAGPAREVAAAPKRRTARSATTSAPGRAGRANKASRSSAALAGFGRAEFATLGALPPPAAADALSARLEPLLMALNDRPVAARVTEARNRAGHAGVRLFRRGSIRPGAPGSIHVFQHGGRWEPQLHVALFAAPQWGQHALAAGIGFNLAEEGSDDKADVGRERVFEYFEAFQQLVSSTWRVHLTDWLRSSGGFVQLGQAPPSTALLPQDAVSTLVQQDNPGALGWAFIGRWLFLDRGEDVPILTDGPSLLRWIEQTFSDLLPLWGEVYRGAYRS